MHANDKRPLCEVGEGSIDEFLSEVGRRKRSVGAEAAVLLIEELVDERWVLPLHHAAELEVRVDAFDKV